MPFGFLKRRQSGRDASGAPAATGGSSAQAGRRRRRHVPPARRARRAAWPFTALTEDWRLHGRMEIAGRLSDALNKREAIAITDVTWGPPESTTLEAALRAQAAWIPTT